MLKTLGLVKRYGEGKKIIFPDFQVPKSTSLLIHGSSGSGKTTLLHILSGLIRQDSGSVSIDNQKLEDLSDYKLDEFRGIHIGICLQKPVFIRSLNVLDNLLLSQKLAHQKSDKKYCITLLEDLGLIHCMNQFTNSLSQGEQQRLMFIRALINKPSLILADEPTSSLDDHNADNIAQLLIQQCQTYKATLIVVSHDERLKKLFDQKILLQ